MKKHCRFIAVISAVICIIGTLFNAFQVRHNSGIMLLTLVIGGMITYMMYIPWAAFAEMLERLENLEWQQRNAAREIKHETESTFETVQAFKGRTLDSGADNWKCPNCGATNAGYVGSCKCGADKP